MIHIFFCPFCMRNLSALTAICSGFCVHDDVIKWKHFLRYWPFVRVIHRSPVNSLHKGQWRGALMISLICVWINGLVNNGEAGDLRRYRAHYDVTVMPRTCRMGCRRNTCMWQNASQTCLRLNAATVTCYELIPELTPSRLMNNPVPKGECV